ncbi:hypothetical protein K450DRAFT_227433 [Umbelopsis ramanniana AG]|uniref:Uncharacterized protein n=1 Tax=Umbelopsis ramanniana AG TaxID=1314678 RepID=A0AAD5HGT5_UMBRA|nr:uncharacterized protein K450DRAFT_227433 [Umbelopsis ramanniana AG]KAI8582494.1 hypothetical protein K450DRAFT_227433 [Umbelopsis ramanniana AG]
MYAKLFFWIALLIIGSCLAAPPYLGEPPIPYRGELKKRTDDSVSATENDNSARNAVHEEYPRRLFLGVYSEKNYKGQKQEWTNANGARSPCWNIDVKEFYSFDVNSHGVNIHFYAEAKCEGAVYTFTSSQQDIKDAKIRESKAVRVTKSN